MHDNRVALVTGANKGIGLQIAKDLAAAGLTILVGSRDLGKGKAAADSIREGAHPIQLDVTDGASIAAAAAHVRSAYGRLDVLVNNAGIAHTGAPGLPFEQILEGNHLSTASLDEVRAVFQTNVFGPLALTQAMLPLLRAAPAGRIVNVSSGAGSLAIQSQPDSPNRDKYGVYSSSKTAFNAVTLALAIDLEDSGIKVNAVCPGFTATDLNSFQGTQTVEQGARHPVHMALIGPDGPTGTFSANSGTMPW